MKVDSLDSCIFIVTETHEDSGPVTASITDRLVGAIEDRALSLCGLGCATVSIGLGLLSLILTIINNTME